MQNRSSIFHLRQELETVEATHINKNNISKQRDELDKHITLLENEIHDELLRLHQNKKKNNQEENNPLNEIDKQKNLLKNLKKKRQDIDHALDLIEENVADQIVTLREQLINAIIEHHPDRGIEYSELTEKIRSLRKKHKETTQLRTGLGRLEEQLEGMLSIRQASRRRGLLQYVFGRSPNSTISKYLVASEALAQELQKVVQAALKQDSLDEKELRPLYQELLSQLIQIEKTCEGDWGFKLIDQDVNRDHQELKHLLEKLDQYIKTTQALLDSLENNVEQWIQELSTP